jgi:nucleoside-diphosphate-sugar epimerase
VRRLAEEGAVDHRALDLVAAPGELRDAIAGCDTLVHLAYSPPRRKGFWPEMADQVELNLLPTISLLEAADSAEVQSVCLASSVSVYSRPAVGVDEDGEVGEGVSPYALVKLHQEALVRAWAEHLGRSAAALRLASVYGPGETAHRVIPTFIRAALTAQPLTVDGRGDQPFDPIFVGDAVEAIISAARRRAHGVFNVGTGRARTAREAAELINRLTGASVDVIENPAVASRGGAVCDVSKAAAELGFRALTDFEAGLTMEIEWVRRGEPGEGGSSSPRTRAAGI